VPFVALTASTLQEDIDHCLAVGMDAHVSKPIDSAALLACVRQFAAPFSEAPGTPTADDVLSSERGRPLSGASIVHTEHASSIANCEDQTLSERNASGWAHNHNSAGAATPHPPLQNVYRTGSGTASGGQLLGSTVTDDSASYGSPRASLDSGTPRVAAEAARSDSTDPPANAGTPLQGTAQAGRLSS
jgi:hypothetical protein